MENVIKNGTTWYDTDGNVLHAHGGWMLRHGGFFYWYGENRTENRYVSCYRSADLVHWEFRNHILTTESKREAIRVRTDLRLCGEDGRKINLERPKVIYNQKTGKYVLWVHYENGQDYTCAAAAVATCDTPDGDFVYHGSFNPFGYMSRDCTLFQEEDGTAYFISTARGNADMHVYRLQDDYLNVAALVNCLWPGEYREAPAVMKKDGRYYMLTSYCTGWQPNQGKYAYADALDGNWTVLENIGDETTYHSQPAFILPVEEEGKTIYLYVGDRWDAKNYDQSTYVFLPLRISEDGEKVELEWRPELVIGR